MGLQEDLAKMADAMERDKVENGEIVGLEKMAFPVEVADVHVFDAKGFSERTQVGSLVRVRPCDKASGDKTYLGIFLGSMILEPDVFYRDKSHKLEVMMHRNPAMFVPELKRIVWGCVSWWSPVETPEDMERMITDESIAKQPCVIALKAMIEAEKKA